MKRFYLQKNEGGANWEQVDEHTYSLHAKAVSRDGKPLYNGNKIIDEGGVLTLDMTASVGQLRNLAEVMSKPIPIADIVRLKLGEKIRLHEIKLAA